MINENIYKIVLSKPQKNQNELRRIEILKNKNMYQASLYGAKKVIHKNMDIDEIRIFVNGHFGEKFSQFNAWDEFFEYESKISKKGKILSSKKACANPPKKPEFHSDSFNRQKNHIIKEGDEVQALVDLDVFSKDFKVLSGKRDKFVQINRFLEIIDDEVKKLKGGTKVKLIDFGCGKSYLTFLLHHYFSHIRQLDIMICGLDSDGEIVQKCQETANKYNYKNMSFIQSDISKLDTPPLEGFGGKNSFGIAICLHACDTATDFAIACAIKWQADLICAVPCCQHELFRQFAPKNLTIFADYGIIRERMSSIATDLIRAKVLESAGYSVQVIEFASLKHTDKNLLIRAKKSGKPNAAALSDIENLCGEFGLSPILLNIVR